MMNSKQTCRLTLSQPVDWVKAFEAAAEADNGMSLSQWVGNACLAALPEKVRRRLSERVKPGKPSGAKRK